MLLARFGKQALMKTSILNEISAVAAKQLSTCSTNTSSNNRNLIDIHPEIRDAIAAGDPVVALESTIITHGMPYPENLETAKAVENIVRDQAAIPATIAIINGRIKVGLNQNELENLANLSPEKVLKCSRRDMGYILSKNLNAGTTVAGTSIIANMVGIKLFATGGIGGVHREGHISMDVSADLTELGRTSICVVSSGIKSILDIPRTLEYLETQGVCVATYKNETKDFPAFYTRSSGVKVPYNLNSALEAAVMIKSSMDIKLESGILIGVPIPEQFAADEKLINDAIDFAIIKANKKGVFGKEVTPFILQALARITSGKSLESNIALIKNNALVASQIAVEFSKLQKGTQNGSETSFNGVKIESTNVNNVPVSK